MPVEQSHVTVPWTGFPPFAIPDASLDSLVPHHLPSLDYLPEPDPTLPVHARTAGKTQQSFPNVLHILLLACPALPVSSHSSSFFFFFYPLPSPSPGKVTGRFLSGQILPPFTGFHPQEKQTKQTQPQKAK